MKVQLGSALVALCLASIASTAPSFNKAASSECSYPIGTKGSNVKVAGRLFEIDGKVQCFAGTNAWWLAHLSSNDDVEISLAQIAKTKYKIVRVWAFGDVTTIPAVNAIDPNKIYFQYLNSSGGYINFGPDGIQRLDYVVSAAERHGIKLVLPFINNWGDYGGIGAYNTAFGGNTTTWYTDKESQKVYRHYIRTLVKRYKKSTAIFAWELGNEPRCRGCPTSIIYNWAAKTSKYIKSLDRNHLVTLGDEGWLAPAGGLGDGSYAYSGYEGVDFIKNMDIKTLDYGVFHLYPNSWGYNYTWGTQWIEQHDAIGKFFGKPVILEEYGTPFPHNHTETVGPWQTAVRNGGLAADQIWQFGPLGTSISPNSVSDDNTIFYGDAEYKSLGEEHAEAMLKKKV